MGDSTNVPVNYDLTVEVFIDEQPGRICIRCWKGMNDQLGAVLPLRNRHEHGGGGRVGRAGADGGLFHQHSCSTTPSPALMKALLINGSRPVANYGLAVTNGINFQGWGLVNLPNSVPPGGLTNSSTHRRFAAFFVDQSPTNALATGDSHTFIVTLTPTPSRSICIAGDAGVDGSAGRSRRRHQAGQQSRPGHHQSGHRRRYIIGNDISPDIGYNLPWDTNSPPNLDTAATTFLTISRSLLPRTGTSTPPKADTSAAILLAYLSRFFLVVAPL